MKKQIIFFDGDGTLWYPKKTTYTQKPGWVYQLPGTPTDHNNHLVMIPTVLETIKKLKKLGVLTAILSAHPQPPVEANIVIQQKIIHFDLHGLFDEVHATRDYHGSKGEFMIEILSRRKIPRSNALMVGDSYLLDYKPAQERGIDALLIESDYIHHPLDPTIKTIKRLSDIFNHIS